MYSRLSVRGCLLCSRQAHLRGSGKHGGVCLAVNLGICGETFESRMSCPFMQLMVIQRKNCCVVVKWLRIVQCGHKRLSWSHTLDLSRLPETVHL
jgi:hypothetical protein